MRSHTYADASASSSLLLWTALLPRSARMLCLCLLPAPCRTTAQIVLQRHVSHLYKMPIKKDTAAAVPSENPPQHLLFSQLIL